MSLISKALKKSQESRQNIQEDKTKGIVYLSDAPQSWPRTALMALLIVCALGAISLSSTAITLFLKNSELKQTQVLNLEEKVKTQERKINVLDTQMHDMKLRLENGNRNVKDQMNDLASNSKDNYDNLKEAILNDKQEIDFLNNYTKKLDQKIEAIAASNTQTKE